MTKIKIIHGDCIEKMKNIRNKSIDMVFVDPPYGQTSNIWDSVIPIKPMWEQLKRITKEKTIIAIMASQPFSSMLVMSNSDMFRYEWVWKKSLKVNFLGAKEMPMRQHELILIFCRAKSKSMYNPQGLIPCNEKIKQRIDSTNYGVIIPKDYIQEFTNWPVDILEISHGNNANVHPTQKPVALMEYFIKTYTKEKQTVLDFAMGSGTTGLACMDNKRNFIGIEKDKRIFELARKRLEERQIHNDYNLKRKSIGIKEKK